MAEAIHAPQPASKPIRCAEELAMSLRRGTIVPRPVWIAEFASGHPTIDDQHLRLINALRELLSSMEAGRSLETLVSAADALLTSCRAHFANEEELLRRIDYPEVVQHAQSHRSLLLGLSNIRNDLSSGTEASLEQIAIRLHNLVVLHLLREDRSYFPYLLISMEGDEEANIASVSYRNGEKTPDG